MTSVPCEVSALPQLRQRPTTGRVDDHVEWSEGGEVLAGAVDHPVDSQRRHGVHSRGAAHSRDLRAERLRDLHREVAHPSACADHGNPLSVLHLPLVSHCLQRSRTGHRQRGRLHEAKARRLVCQLPLLGAGELGERSGRGAEHFVAGVQPSHRITDLLHDARHAHARSWVLRRPQAKAHQPNHVGQPRDEVPHTGVDTGRSHPHQHVRRADCGWIDVREREHLSAAIGALHDRLHTEAVSRNTVQQCRRDCRAAQ